MPEIPEPDFSKIKPRYVNTKPSANPFLGLGGNPKLEYTPPERNWVPVSRVETTAAESLILGMSRDDAIRTLSAWSERQKEGLNVWSPNEEQGRFHASKANIRLLLGGNRSGKSLCAAVELARAVTGCDPYDKYPKRDGIAVVVAKSEDGIADIIWDRLYKPGAFQMLRDVEREEREHSLVDLWRAVRMNEPADLARRDEWIPSYPMLPHRLCSRKDVHWANAGRGVPGLVRIPSTGWEIRFFTGGSTPRAGFVADLCWIDEELENEQWSLEMRARLVDRGGCLFWSATPENCSQALYDLYERFLKNDKYVDCFKLNSLGNIYTSDEEKAKFYAGMSEETKRVKQGGEFRLGGQRIFPEFNWEKHSCKSFNVPRSWSRFLSIDPGSTVATVLFAAVPPESDPLHFDRVYVYDELMVTDSTAAKLAEAIKARIGSDDFDTWIIDWHMARQRQMGSGLTIIDQYEAAFKELSLRSNLFGVSFEHGQEGHVARNEAIHTWLASDRPILQIFDHCIVTRSQMERYHRQRNKVTGLVEDKPVKLNDHCVDALGMLAAYNPQYRKKNIRTGKGPVAVALAIKNKRAKGSGGGIMLGPGGVPPKKT